MNESQGQKGQVSEDRAMPPETQVSGAATGNASGGPSVLLPSARVALFVMDADLRAEAKALMNDWRFARVTFDIRDGNIESAITAYEAEASPELVIVETATIGEEFTAKLGVLAGNCADTTSAVVVGPVNDVYLYRKLIEMGVSDYLVRPINRDVLAAVIAKALIDKFGASESQLVAFIGAKGGLGTSTIAQNFALATSEELDEKTAILDAAGGWSYLSISFGQEPITTLSEVTRAVQSSDQDAFKRMLTKISDKLTVLGTGADMMLDDPVQLEAFEMILNRLMVSYPVVVVDLSGATSAVKRMVISKAHHINIVTTPGLPGLRATRTLLQEVKSLKGQIETGVSLFLNMVGQHAGHEISKPDIEKAMERKIDFVQAYNPKLFIAAETQGKKISDVAGGEEFHQIILTLAKKILSKDVKTVTRKKENSLLSGLFSKMKGK